jgi:hypothetical protein
MQGRRQLKLGPAEVNYYSSQKEHSVLFSFARRALFCLAAATVTGPRGGGAARLPRQDSAYLKLQNVPGNSG